MGGIKRLNVAVVVNNMPVIDKAGKVTYRPLTAAEKTQINDLAMQAMGFSKERGDSLTVVNTSFAGEPVEVAPPVPLWENPRVIEYGKDGLRFVIGLVVLLMLYSKIMKPLLSKLTAPSPKMMEQRETVDTAVTLGDGQAAVTSNQAVSGYDQNLLAAKQLAKDNPKMVASVVANWTNGNES
jgi:flagellar M-ring protein FliF